MPTYKAPVEDVQFLLNDVFHMERYGNLPGFSDVSPDTLAAIEKYNIEDGISYISTGGGAFLEFVEGKTLPAVAVLEERAKG